MESLIHLSASVVFLTISWMFATSIHSILIDLVLIVLLNNVFCLTYYKLVAFFIIRIVKHRGKRSMVIFVLQLLHQITNACLFSNQFWPLFSQSVLVPVPLTVLPPPLPQVLQRVGRRPAPAPPTLVPLQTGPRQRTDDRPHRLADSICCIQTGGI